MTQTIASLFGAANFRTLCLVLLILCTFMATPIQAKRVSGDFKLSGVNSEKVLGSFAVVPEGALLRLHLTAADTYETEQYLKLRLYNDLAWNKHLKVMTCQEKRLSAVQSYDISFDYLSKKWQMRKPIEHIFLNKDNKFKKRALKKAKPTGDEEGKEEEEPPMTKEERLIQVSKTVTASDRPQYWYIAIDDCMLEQHNLDSRVPMIHYELDIVNQLGTWGGTKSKTTHLSADEMKLARVHFFTLLVSGGVAFLLCMNAGLTAVKGKQQQMVHAAVLWVALAASMDAGSSLCELMHLKLYERNGIGSYFFDAIAAYLEAICDSLLILLLLSIGAGWTLPSDAVRVSAYQTPIQGIFQDLASPLRSITHLGVASVIFWSTIALHLILAQWGRIYNDDFESYHDLEHTPGKILMIFRIVLGWLLVAATMRTHMNCKSSQLQAFYLKLAALGFFWFQSLPCLTYFCNKFVPYYLRHPYVFTWSALLQSGSLVMLAWLVTAHTKSSAYHQYSHMAASFNEGRTSLTESLNNAGGGAAHAPKVLSFGKAKIALD